MYLNYLIPLGLGISGGLIHRHFRNRYLNETKDKKIYGLINYQYETNILNTGMFYGLTLGFSYLALKNNYLLLKNRFLS